ncbi:MAG: class I SAM-dependent methyltransferase [Chloroflexi bacterium]|nr:class I SAM-dependent methyltransferase [Chloroflexota bacterium]
MCRSPLSATSDLDDIETGRLVCQQGHAYPVLRGVPRFVSQDAYTSSFSYEWDRFRKTQLDSWTGRHDTRDRLQASLNFPLDQLRGKLVLDAGCGMGRFAEIVQRYGATYVGMDYSYAVDAAYQNAGHAPGVHFVQADIFAPPFADGTFDLAMSLGVLHHTPDPGAAFSSVSHVVKEGGQLTITVYDAGNRVYVANSRFWRKYTTALPRQVLHALSFAAVPLYYLWTLPRLGWFFRAVGFISLEPDWRWRVLDTFDWYSPRFQSWHTHYEVFGWFKANRFEKIEVLGPSVSQIGTKMLAQVGGCAE